MSTRLIRHTSLVLLPAFGALVAHANAQTVHVVNASGPALGAATNAASSGDTILVRGGPYDSFSVVGKQLTVVADQVAPITCHALSVANLTTGQTATIKGFAFDQWSFLHANAGAVRIEDCSFQDVSDAGVLEIAFSSDVALTRCSILALPPIEAGTSSSIALDVEASTVALYDSVCTGAKGADFGARFVLSQILWFDAQPGAAGARFDAASTLFASRTTFTGGQGGKGRSLFCASPFFGAGPLAGASGGDGLVCAGAANALDCAFVAGLGGDGGTGGQCCAGCTPYVQAPAGPNGQATNGTVNLIAGVGCALVGSRIIREASPLSLAVTGTSGDLVWVAFSGKTRWSFDPNYSGVFLFSTMLRRKFLGAIPPGGVLNVALPWSDLPIGVDAWTRHMQAVTRTASGAFVLSSPTHVVIVDSAY